MKGASEAAANTGPNKDKGGQIRTARSAARDWSGKGKKLKVQKGATTANCQGLLMAAKCGVIVANQPSATKATKATGTERYGDRRKLGTLK